MSTNIKEMRFFIMVTLPVMVMSIVRTVVDEITGEAYQWTCSGMSSSCGSVRDECCNVHVQPGYDDVETETKCSKDT